MTRAMQSIVASGRQRLLLQSRKPERRRLAAFALALALAATAATAAESPGDFAARAPIELAGCQSASNFDPRSASKIDPLGDVIWRGLSG